MVYFSVRKLDQLYTYHAYNNVFCFYILLFISAPLLVCIIIIIIIHPIQQSTNELLSPLALGKWILVLFYTTRVHYFPT